MKERIPVGMKIQISGKSFNYDEIAPVSLENARLTDKEGVLEFTMAGKGMIETQREIKGVLRVENGPAFDYKREGRRENDEKHRGKRIVLVDDDTSAMTADDELQDRVGLFIDIISASMDLEVWEDQRNPPADKRIKVYKIFREEGVLELARLPNTRRIYPPNISYQLEVQKRAIENLMYYPAREHRALLKLFEGGINVSWPSLVFDFSSQNVKFEFLTTDKESTPIQQDFVLKAMNTPDYCILEGPPGSGKTTAITELIFQLIKRGNRIMLASSTHVAVDNVLEKLLERFGTAEKLMQEGIVPLRIGLEERVSTDIQPFQHENRKKVLIEKMSAIDAAWEQHVTPFDREEVLNDYLCYSSNLVCGTTIGIMQYPAIKRIRKEKTYVKPQFDYLIVDEASKTTFQEFLVPAIYARRWIIVGDVRQLSPYTDILYAQVNLESLRISKNERTALLVLMKMHFETNKMREKPKFIYDDDFTVISALYRILKEKILEDQNFENEKKRYAGTNFVFFTDNPLSTREESIPGITCVTFKGVEQDISMLAKLYSADIIFTSGLTKNTSKILPAYFIFFSPNNRDFKFMFTHYAWCKRKGWNAYEYPLPKGKRVSDVELIYSEILGSLKKSWAAEVAWRLKRIYELENVKRIGRKDPTKYYLASLWALLPAESYGIRDDIKKIGQILFPSILTSLQTGVTKFFRKDSDKTVLSSGFPANVLKTRHVLLQFQNRMHKEISELPRRLFYQEIGALQDTKDIAMGIDRDWDCSLFNKHRLVWIDVKGGKAYHNQNQKEADTVFHILEKILDYTKKRKPKDKSGEWSVALLTFYERQRLLFRDIMRKRYPENDNPRKQTQFKVGNTRVFCYTIDKVQGREADVVILSMVQNQRVGFMDCPNRLNVALTRAKYLQIIVGDKAFFSSDHNKSWELTEIATNTYSESI
ncbi:MAG: AAA domain-containing protein [Candidatus Sigynarchaeota archaeon]